MKNETNLSSDIYYKMLEYGSNALHDGITYSEIKSKLITNNFFKEGQDETYLKDWFNESFFHREKGCKCPRNNDCGCNEDDPCDSYDHVANCPHHIHSESCMNLLHLRESENNKVSAQNSYSIAKFALIIACIALVSPIVDIYQLFKKKKEEESLESLKSNVSKIQNEVLKISPVVYNAVNAIDSHYLQSMDFLERQDQLLDKQNLILKKLNDVLIKIPK